MAQFTTSFELEGFTPSKRGHKHRCKTSPLVGHKVRALGSVFLVLGHEDEEGLVRVDELREQVLVLHAGLETAGSRDEGGRELNVRALARRGLGSELLGRNLDGAPVALEHLQRVLGLDINDGVEEDLGGVLNGGRCVQHALVDLTACHGAVLEDYIKSLHDERRRGGHFLVGPQELVLGALCL